MAKKPVTVLLTDTHKNKENLEQVFDIFQQAGNLAKKLGCSFVTHLGDIFTNRIGQTLQTLLAFQLILDYYDSIGLKLFLIPGNHDKTNLDSEESYLDVYVHHPACKLFSKESRFDVNKSLSLCFLPYFSTSYTERLRSLNKSLDLKQNNVLLTHVAINGVRNNDGSEVTEGIEIGKFKPYKMVFVGHYHNASDIGNNIRYMGAAYQANFGENVEDKGFTILYDDCTFKFVHSTFKKFIKVKLDVTDKSAINNELERLQESGDNIRFIFTGKRADLDSINISKFTDVGIDCKFEGEEMEKTIEEAEGNEFVQFDKKTIIKNFLNFCKTQGITPDKRTMGLKLLKEI